MQYINCKQYAADVKEQVKKSTTDKSLVILTMGDDPASAAYVKGKKKDCEECGIPYIHDIVTTEQELYDKIASYNIDDAVGGIILQLPLPEGINASRYTNMIFIHKDVDGFTPNSYFLPCTPEGVVYIMEHELGDLDGLNVVILGRGELVGKPLIPILLGRNCTITVCHSHTKNMYEHIEHADVVISAVGKPKFLDLQRCGNTKLVIDVGINRDENGKMCGDAYNFDEAALPHLKVTPVPGGVGLMTRAILMKHMSLV